VAPLIADRAVGLKSDVFGGDYIGSAGARGRLLKFSFLIALPLMGLLCGCTAPSGFGPIAIGDPQSGNITKGEAGRLAASHGRARRQGDDLILTFADGKSRSFHSNTKGCQDGPDDCDGFTLIGDLPRFHWFVLFESLYEGGNFLLVDDQTGLPTPIPYWPTFSPDGTRFLILNDDVTDFFPGENLEIWRRWGNRAEREWIGNPDERDTGVPDALGPYHIKLLRWKGDVITLAFSTDDTFNTKTQTATPARHWTGTLRRGPDGWLLSARGPAKD